MQSLLQYLRSVVDNPDEMSVDQFIDASESHLQGNPPVNFSWRDQYTTLRFQDGTEVTIAAAAPAVIDHGISAPITKMNQGAGGQRPQDPTVRQI